MRLPNGLTPCDFPLGFRNNKCEFEGNSVQENEESKLAPHRQILLSK